MKIGFVSMPWSGHLNPMTALARRLRSRGNEVILISFPDAEPFARAAGLNFVPFGENEYPAGSIATLCGPASKLHGLEATHWSLREMSCALFGALKLTY
jgi:UDP:flavonoid glycosyltransferase YjiC (YdhE family)